MNCVKTLEEKYSPIAQVAVMIFGNVLNVTGEVEGR